MLSHDSTSPPALFSTVGINHLFNDGTLANKLAIHAKYHQMEREQQEELSILTADQQVVLPDHVDYQKMSFLSAEVRERLMLTRPNTMAQVKRMPGITPDAIVRLLRFLTT